MNKSRVLRRTTDGRYVWKSKGKYKYKNGRLLLNYHSPPPTSSSLYVPDLCSRGIVDTSDSDESYVLEDNVNKLLNPSECKFRRPINFFNNVEQNPQKLRKSIITRALQNVISSTPMPSKHIRNFISTDISLDLSPINGNEEQLHNDNEEQLHNDNDIQEDRTIINNENKLKSQSSVITISDSENNENYNPQISSRKGNTSKGIHTKSTKELEVMKLLSRSRNNCDEKNNSKKKGNSSRKKNQKPQKLSNSFTKSVWWTKKMTRSNSKLNNEDELNISEDATLVDDQIKIKSKLNFYSDNQLNNGTKKKMLSVESDIKGVDSNLFAKKLCLVSATTESEKQDSLEELQEVTSKTLLNNKNNQTKMVPPKPAPRKTIKRQKRVSHSNLAGSKEKNIAENATSPCNFIVQENEVLQGSVDNQINNSIPSESRLNGTKKIQPNGRDCHKDDVKTLTDVATSPCSFGKKQVESVNETAKMQSNGQITEIITNTANSPTNSDKKLKNHSVQVSKNRLKNSSILKCNANQETVTDASKINKNNSILCETVKRFIDIGTSPCSFSKEQQNTIQKQLVDTSQQEKMTRLHQLIDNLSNTKNVEDSRYSAIEDNRKMMSKEIQTSTEAMLDKNPFKHFGRNISTQTVAEMDNRSDTTSESNLLTEFDNDLLFRTVQAPNDFSSFISSDSEFSMLEDSNKNCPWRLADDLIPMTETGVSFKLNFLRSARLIQEERQSLIDNNLRFSSDNQKISAKKGKGSRKNKSDKFRQYTRKSSKHYSQRKIRAIPLSPIMTMDLRKKRSLTNTENGKNASTQQSKVSELNATCSTVTVRNSTNVNSDNIRNLANSSLQPSMESGRGNSTNECTENTVDTQPVKSVEKSPELIVNISKSSLISQRIYNVPTSELSNKLMNRSDSVRKNANVQFSEKNKKTEKTNIDSQDELPEKSLNNSKINTNKGDFSNFDDLAKRLDKSLIEKSQVSEKLHGVNCNIDQKEPLEKGHEEPTSDVSRKIRTKSKMKSISNSGGIDVDNTSHRDVATYSESLEKNDVAVQKMLGSRRDLKQAFENCGVVINKNNADEITDLDYDCSIEKLHSVNCSMEKEQPLEKRIDVSKNGPKSKMKNIDKHSDAAMDTISNCNAVTCEPLEKSDDVAVFKVPKKRLLKPKSKHVTESCGNIPNNHDDSVDGDQAIGIRRSRRQRKPVTELSGTGVFVTHSIKEFKYFDVVHDKEDIEKTSSRKSKSKLKGVQSKPEKIMKMRINKKQIITSDKSVHDIELESSEVENNEKIEIQSCQMVLHDNKNPEIQSSFQNIYNEISYESQPYTIRTNESINHPGTSHPNNEHLNSRHITADSGRATLSTFDESNLHSVQKIGKITKNHKRKNNVSNKISKILSRSTIHSNQIEIADKLGEIDITMEGDHSFRRERRINIKSKENDFIEVLENNERVDLKYVNKDHAFVHECDNLMITDSLKNSNYPILGGYLKLPPGGRKLLHIPQSHSLFYFVVEGNGHIQVGNSVSKVQKMDNFIVPVGIRYAIFNDSPKDPLLLSCVKIAVSRH